MTWEFEEEHELDLLEDLFEMLDVEKPTKEQMYKLFGVFLEDFDKNPFSLEAKIVGYDKNKSRHPLFKGKPKGFEHICTRENKYKGIRDFDNQRTNKIHWIKPIVLNKENARVKYFQKTHSKGQNQHFLWLHEKDYVVIIREIVPNLQLITAFVVDGVNKNRYMGWYKKYREN
jgi:hypothetical protein